MKIFIGLIIIGLSPLIVMVNSTILVFILIYEVLDEVL